jgi:hypothetical protein
MLEGIQSVKAAAKDVFDCTKAGGRDMKTIDVEAVRNQRMTITVSLSMTKAIKNCFLYCSMSQEVKKPSEICVKLMQI